MQGKRNPGEGAALSMLSELMRDKGGSDPANITRAVTEAWQISGHSEKVLKVGIFLLTDHALHGDAIGMLQQAIGTHGETPDLLRLMAKVAMGMGTYDVGEKVLQRVIALGQVGAEDYVTLVTCLLKQERTDQAFDLAKATVERFPEDASAWNALGILAKDELGDYQSACEFFRQAIALDKEKASYYHNMGLAVRPDTDHQRFWLFHALHLEPENSQFNLTYSFYLFANGDYTDAWSHYWYRRDPLLGTNKASRIDHNYEPWTGQALAGKSILVCAEQGVGDEAFFLMGLRGVAAACKQVFVVCDPRLVPLVNRSFENCRAFPFDDMIKYGIRYRDFPALKSYLEEAKAQIDFFALMGDLMHYGCPSKEAFLSQESGYFVPKPALVETYRDQFRQSHRKKIGISWRSGNLSSERKHFYLSLAFFAELSERVNADFYVLQYTMNDEERRYIEGFPNIRFIYGLDLKQDIDGNVAAISELDLVMGPPVATQQFALAAGKPIWLINGGRPWYFLDEDALPPFFPEGSRWWQTVKDTSQIKDEVAAALHAFLSADSLQG